MEKSRLGLGLLLAASISGACLVGCGDDDTTTTGPGAGGAGGSAGGGSAGKGGSGGGATGGNAGSTGGGGATGGGGTGGNRTDAGDSGPCTKPGITKVVPMPPAAIAVPAGQTLIGGYYAEGQQIYTCVANPTSDAGASDAASGDGGSSDAAPAAGGTWANTAEAIVYGDTCTKAADHGYTATPGSPFWKATDGSQVTAARQAASPAPVPDGGDGGAVAIAWVLLKSTANTGTGVFSNVTYVQRLNTTGGVGPSGACEPGDANPVRKVDYTAVYYFYKEATTEGGTSEGGATEGGATEGGATEAGATEAGAD
jgi:hypothetical protein